MTDPNPRPAAKKKRRWPKVLAGGLLVVLALVAALPLGLATPSGQRWLAEGANRGLAPGGGRIAWTSLRFSWFGPMRLTGLVLRDAEGDEVVAAPRATVDRNLFQLLFDRPRYGTLMLEGGALDVQQRPDGTVDLYETIKPILRFDPRTQLKVVVAHGKLRYRSPQLAEPLNAEQAEIALDVGPAPRPIRWRLDLKQPPPRGAGGTPATLAISGRYERWWQRGTSPKDLEVAIEGQQWPWAWAVDSVGLEARGVLDGRLAFRHRSGVWSFTGDATLGAFEASGPRLAGDRLRLERITGAWDLEKTPGAWLVRKLDLKSPIATLTATGPLPAPPGTSSRIEGSLNLAALAAQLPHALRVRDGIVLESGMARLQAESRPDAWDVAASISDLRASEGSRAFTLESPATIKALVQVRPGAWTLQRLEVHTAFGDATGEGDLDAGISWTAKLDLAGFQRQLRGLVDFGTLELAGKGDLAGDYRRQKSNFAGYVTATLNDLHLGDVIPDFLARDAVRLEAAFAGPIDDFGIPRDWSRLELKLSSGGANAHIAATARGTVREATLTAAVPWAPQADRKGRFEGKLSGRWDQTGARIDVARLALVPAGPEWPGVPITILAEGRYDSARGELVLTPRPAAGNSPAPIVLAPDGLRIGGLGRRRGLRVDAALAGNLGALERVITSWGGPAVGGPTGNWSARSLVQETDEGWQFGGQLDIPDAPARLALRGGYQRGRDRIDVTELVLAGRYAAIEASGQLSDLGGARRVDLLGKLTPDWNAINRLLSERVEPRARIAGRARPVRLQGSLAGQTLEAIDGEVGVDVTAADIFGMNLGPTAIVLRARTGRLQIDPIETTLNQGRLHLEPTLVLDEPAGPALRLGPESSLTDARINDEVSHRVLAFAAPVLDRATRARGRVSVRLTEATFPISEDPARLKTATVTGSVLFQDAEFVAGPIADQLFDLLGMVERPGIKLNQPVALTIADRRVYQRGLAIPLGQLNEVTMEGWVDFDRNLAMNASLPLLPTMWRDRPDRPVLNGLFGGLRITVPIRGTLDNPVVDKNALDVAMQDLGKSLLERTAGPGAVDFLQRLFPPRDPNAPPPLTPEERRQQRQQRRQERRMQP
jgi:translocation and assembly module TamB